MIVFFVLIGRYVYEPIITEQEKVISKGEMQKG